jgi:PAS domain S-box-containing protein
MTENSEKSLRLGEFLRIEKDGILDDWERADRQIAAAATLPSQELRDSIPVILSEIAEQADKVAEGYTQVEVPHAVPQTHGKQRVLLEFSLEEVAREYALLRRVILERLGPRLGQVDPREIVFLNEALDEALHQAVIAYTSAATRDLQAAETRYRRIRESGILGVVEWHRSGELVAANDAFLRMLGYSRQDLEAGRLNFRDLTPAELQEATGRTAQTLKATGVCPAFETQYLRKNGNRIDVLFSGISLDAEAEHGLGLILDISARKALAEEEAMRAEFERQLIGIVSHDLRSPLGAIAVAAALLLRRQDLDARTRSIVTKIVSASERAHRMIHDLLDFTQARLGGGIPIHRKTESFHELVAQALDEVRLAHPEHTIAFEQEGGGVGEWDADRIAQIVTNLVSNALTYGAPGRPVYVHASSDVDEVELTVQNWGTPIDPGLLPEIFDPLRQGDPRIANPSRSLGLGLFIVKKLVDAHGGTIRVRSSDEEGTIFTIRLPRHLR